MAISWTEGPPEEAIFCGMYYSAFLGMMIGISVFIFVAFLIAVVLCWCYRHRNAEN